MDTDNVQWTLFFDPPPPTDNVHSHTIMEPTLKTKNFGHLYFGPLMSKLHYCMRVDVIGGGEGGSKNNVHWTLFVAMVEFRLSPNTNAFPQYVSAKRSMPY